MEASYDTFITAVSESRPALQKPQVDALARGRVWSGADARARGLVDGFGGLHEALEAARRRSGVKASEELDVEVMGEPSGFFLSGGGEPDVLGRLLPAAARATPPEPLVTLARELGLGEAATWAAEPGPRAALPFRVDVR